MAVGDLLVNLVGDPLFAAAGEPGAQAAQVEEQRFLGRAGAAANDRPVPQDVILHRGADPPGGVGGEAHLALRIEAGRGLQQAHMAFLDQIGHGQAVMPEPGRDRDDEPHMSGGQLMKRRFIAVVLPANGQQPLLLPFEEWRVHGGADKLATNP